MHLIIFLLSVSFFNASDIKERLVKHILFKTKYLPYSTLSINTLDKKNVKITHNTAAQCDLFSVFVEDGMEGAMTIPFSSNDLKRCDKLLKKTKNDTTIGNITYYYNTYDKIKKLYWACDFLMIPLEIQEQLLEKILYSTKRVTDLGQSLLYRIMQKEDFFVARGVRGFCRKHIHCAINTYFFDKVLSNSNEESLESVSNITFYASDALLKYHTEWDEDYIYLKVEHSVYGIIFDGFFDLCNAKKIKVGEIDKYFGIILNSKKWDTKELIYQRAIYLNVTNALKDIENLIGNNNQHFLLPYIKYENKRICCNNALELHTEILFPNNHE